MWTAFIYLDAHTERIILNIFYILNQLRTTEIGSIGKRMRIQEWTCIVSACIMYNICITISERSIVDVRHMLSSLVDKRLEWVVNCIMSIIQNREQRQLRVHLCFSFFQHVNACRVCFVVCARVLVLILMVRDVLVRHKFIYFHIHSLI